MLLQQETLLSQDSVAGLAKSLKGRVQLPSAIGAFASLDLPAVRLSVNTCCSGLPQRPERHRSRSQAPFQNLPRSPSVPASAQHRHAASSCSREDAPASPVSPPPAKATVHVQCMGQARGRGHARKPGGQPKRAHLLGEHWGLHPCGGDRLAAWRRTRGRSSRGVWRTTNTSQGRIEEQREGGQHPGDIRGVYAHVQISRGGQGGWTPPLFPSPPGETVRGPGDPTWA